MRCGSPFLTKGGLYVPCGSCFTCREKRKKEWAHRIVQHMASTGQEASFVLLTYSDEYLPSDGSLKPDHLRLFWMRLRKLLRPRLIQYYANGEYGEINGRPHYHSIIFNYPPTLDLRKQEHPYEVLSGPLQESWPYGYITSDTVSEDSAAYTAGYIQKKLTGDLQSQYGTSLPPFSRMSKGIGLLWAQENSEKLKQKLYYTKNGKPQHIPRYYRKKLGITAQDYLSKNLTWLTLKFTEYAHQHSAHPLDPFLYDIKSQPITGKKNYEKFQKFPKDLLDKNEDSVYIAYIRLSYKLGNVIDGYVVTKHFRDWYLKQLSTENANKKRRWKERENGRESNSQ